MTTTEYGEDPRPRADSLQSGDVIVHQGREVTLGRRYTVYRGWRLTKVGFEVVGEAIEFRPDVKVTVVRRASS